VSELRRRGFPEEALGADISAIETGKPGGVTALQLWASLWPECEQNVMLVGPAGTGKTYAAVALSKALLATKGALPWFTTAAGLLQRLRATVRDDATEHEGQILGGLQRVPVLVLDDIGREKLTDFAAERLFGLINHRWSNKLTTIATANMDTYMALPEAWRSRLSSGVLVTFEGLADKRLKRDKPRRML
jgi:DNA replication protein DnaC